MVSVYTNARIVTDGAVCTGRDVVVEEGRIAALLPTGTAEGQVIDCGGCFLSPGFIDLHCHGGAGYEFIDATPEAILAACRIHACKGTRVLYPTISAADIPTTYRALATIEQVQSSCPVEIAGVHLEGPYLSPEMCGAQDTRFLTDPIPSDYLALLKRFGGLIRRWTYAPERDDGLFARTLVENGVLPSMGHTAAEYADVSRAVDNGCTLVTHLYSCTSTITRHGGFRHLGVIESAYLLDEIYVEIIADGCHLPPELLRLVVKGKGVNRTCLCTDAIRYAGLSPDSRIGGTEQIPYIIEDGVAKLMDRSAFAGSIATTDQLLSRTVGAGIPLPDAVAMLTQTPASVMGLSHKGHIAPGYDAQFTLFTDDFQIVSL